MPRLLLGGLAAFACLAGADAHADCGADVLGTSRTLTLAREAASYGAARHAALPLAAGEVVITFDDGPRLESTPRVLAERLMERLATAGRGILLLHDAQDQTADALPLLLSSLKAGGYRVVHLEWVAPSP